MKNTILLLALFIFSCNAGKPNDKWKEKNLQTQQLECPPTSDSIVNVIVATIDTLYIDQVPNFASEKLLTAYEDWKKTGFASDAGGLKKLGVIVGMILQRPSLLTFLEGFEKYDWIKREVEKRS